MPRDRQGTFEPQLIGKHQRRLAGFDEKILALYAKGLTTRDIQEIVKELYGVEVSASLVSEITQDLDAEVKAWQTRRLEAVVPIVFLDGIVVHIRGESGRVSEHTMYVAIGVNFQGKKELLGLWLEETEGAKFWLSCLTDLKNRGLGDIFLRSSNLPQKSTVNGVAGNLWGDRNLTRFGAFWGAFEAPRSSATK
jgi:transposase-like protein